MFGRWPNAPGHGIPYKEGEVEEKKRNKGGEPPHNSCSTRAAPMHMLDIPMDSLPYGGRRAADSKHRSGLPPSFFFFLSPPLFPNTMRDFPLVCADHEHGVCRHAHVPNSHSPEASASPCGRAWRKDEGCARRPVTPSPPTPALLFQRARPKRPYTSYHTLQQDEDEGRPRALTCTRALLPRFFERQLAFQNTPDG